MSEIHVAAAELTSSDGPALQQLFESDAGFFERVMGHPPGAEAQSAFSALPEGRDYDDKYLIGAWTRGTESGGSMEELVGVIDLIRNHPAPQTWTLGLIFVHPSRRLSGVATALMRSCASWLARKGVATLRLGVLDENAGVLPFFEGLGFNIVETRDGVTAGLKTTRLHVPRVLSQAGPKE
jgi:uncharacterized protein